MSVVLAACAAVLFGVGTYLLLQRKLSRIIIGLGLISHGGNILWLTSGRLGDEPIIGEAPSRAMADPLPHALALTTIVIMFGVTAFLLALAFRSWVLTSDDEVENDIADILVARGREAPTYVADEQLAESELQEADERAALRTAGELVESDRGPVR